MAVLAEVISTCMFYKKIKVMILYYIMIYYDIVSLTTLNFAVL